MWREKPNIKSLRKALVADSIAREKQMRLLLKLVREDERARTFGDLADKRSKAQSELTRVP